MDIASRVSGIGRFSVMQEESSVDTYGRCLAKFCLFILRARLTPHEAVIQSLGLHLTHSQMESADTLLQLLRSKAGIFCTLKGKKATEFNLLDDHLVRHSVLENTTGDEEDDSGSCDSDVNSSREKDKGEEKLENDEEEEEAADEDELLEMDALTGKVLDAGIELSPEQQELLDAFHDFIFKL